MRIDDINDLSEDILKLNPELTKGGAALARAQSPRQSEKSFQAKVVKILHEHGYKIMGVYPARIKRHGEDVYRSAYMYDGNGFPDLCAVNPETGVLLFIENKSESGKPSVEQTNWLMWLSQVKTVKTMILKPGNIESLLGKI